MKREPTSPVQGKPPTDTINAYGKPYIYSGSTLTPLSNYTGTLYGNSRLYTGREYDRETGYYYLRARIYSPDLGRFLSRDPVGQNDQVNLYTYVANSPLKYVDRMGREKVLIIAFAGHSISGFGEIPHENYSQYGVGQALLLSNDKYTKKLYNSSLFFDDEVSQARSYINEHKGEFNKLIILGHSLGADNAVELAQGLNDDKINVDLLLTVDLQAGLNTTNVPDNVNFAKNYYQTNWNSVVNGEVLTQSSNSRPASFVSNVKVNNACDVAYCNASSDNYSIGHTNIDGEVAFNIVDDIKARLK